MDSRNWVQRICRRILQRRAVPASEQEAQVEHVRILHVGKDTCAGSWSDYHHDYSDAHSLPLFYHEDADMSEDIVPYLDDCHDEKIAACLMRRQSLLRRNLHRMSLLLARQPAELRHAATLENFAY
ncbi:hypothetical protein GGI20_004811 [Coemansia sp. BCRC 34301]|nr:hypothetical protein GGI20_004811 [Coemansia sp. BCRC 34301]